MGSKAGGAMFDSVGADGMGKPEKSLAGSGRGLHEVHAEGVGRSVVRTVEGDGTGLTVWGVTDGHRGGKTHGARCTAGVPRVGAGARGDGRSEEKKTKG